MPVFCRVTGSLSYDSKFMPQIFESAVFAPCLVKIFNERQTCAASGMSIGYWAFKHSGQRDQLLL